MGLPNRDRIAAFGAVLALRTALKRASAAERAALAAADRRGERTCGPDPPVKA